MAALGPAAGARRPALDLIQQKEPESKAAARAALLRPHPRKCRSDGRKALLKRLMELFSIDAAGWRTLGRGIFPRFGTRASPF